MAEGLREQGDDVSRVAPTSDCRHREERQPHLLLFRLTRPDSLGEAKGTGAFAAGASGLPAVVHIVDQAEEEDRITALDSGVDDVVVLPVSTRELAARLRAIIRRSHSAPRRSLLTYKDIVLDPVAGEATRNGRHRSLTRKEFRLLQVLMEHLGRPVSRQRLVEEVWGPGHHLEMRTVDAHIHRLRAAMGDDRAEVIRTVRHAGYVMGDQAQPGAS